MSITNPVKRLHRASPWMHGPELAFAGTLLIAFAAMVAGTKMLPGDLVLPVVSTIFFVLACLVALVAMLRERVCDQRRMTYWDVAGLSPYSEFASRLRSMPIRWCGWWKARTANSRSGWHIWLTRPPQPRRRHPVAKP